MDDRLNCLFTSAFLSPIFNHQAARIQRNLSQIRRPACRVVDNPRFVGGCTSSISGSGMIVGTSYGWESEYEQWVEE